MDCINLPQEIFDLIVDHLKSQKYNITTIRHLVRTCQKLNLTLCDCILSKQEEYWYPYIILNCKINRTPNMMFINELVLDSNKHFEITSKWMNIYGLTFNFNNHKVKYDDIMCYAAAITCNVPLIKKIFKKFSEKLHGIGKCVGYAGNYDMFRFFEHMHLNYGFWLDCFKGALIGDNVEFLKYCRIYGTVGIAVGIRDSKHITGLCKEWLLKYNYL